MRQPALRVKRVQLWSIRCAAHCWHGDARLACRPTVQDWNEFNDINKLIIRTPIRTEYKVGRFFLPLGC